MAKTPGVVKRRELADKGIALPDGSFPIADKEDLKKAIAAFGLGKHPSLAKAHIIKRARALGATDLLPAKWMKQGVTKEAVRHSSLTTEEHNMTLDTISTIGDQENDQAAEFLAHFGVKGMRWGIRHEPTSGGGGGGSRSGGSSSGGSSGGARSSAPGQRKGLSTKQKVAIGVGAAAVVAVGAAAVAYHMKTGGKLPINVFQIGRDLKGSAFKAANGGFDRARAISEIAKREGRSAALIGELKGRQLGRDLGGVAKTTGQGVSRLAGMGSVAANNARAAAPGAARSVARDLQGLSEPGRAAVSRLWGESISSRLMANREIASARISDLKGVAGELKGVAKTTGEGVSRLATPAVNAASRAVAKSGPQALVNLRARRLLKGM